MIAEHLKVGQSYKCRNGRAFKIIRRVIDDVFIGVDKDNKMIQAAFTIDGFHTTKELELVEKL